MARYGTLEIEEIDDYRFEEPDDNRTAWGNVQLEYDSDRAKTIIREAEKVGKETSLLIQPVINPRVDSAEYWDEILQFIDMVAKFHMAVGYNKGVVGMRHLDYYNNDERKAAYAVTTNHNRVLAKMQYIKTLCGDTFPETIIGKLKGKDYEAFRKKALKNKQENEYVSPEDFFK